jgi:glyceraldehyde 3-phosphate dehydrogenase
MTNVAINGLGRIGRATLKIVMDTAGLNLVAVNDLSDAAALVYSLKYDTVYGRYERSVEAAGDHLLVGGHRVRLLRERTPARLPWQSLNVDLVFECTGALTAREDLDEHVRAGARNVILSAPSRARTSTRLSTESMSPTRRPRSFRARAAPRTASRQSWRFWKDESASRKPP